MKQLKIISILSVLLLLDLTRPFADSLNVDFLFLGIIFLAANWRLQYALPIALAFGYAKDSLMPAQESFSVIEFGLLALGIHYFLSLFLITREETKTFIKAAAITGALITHLFLMVSQSSKFLPFFTLNFFLQSFFLYFFLEFFFKRLALGGRGSSLH